MGSRIGPISLSKPENFFVLTHRRTAQKFLCQKSQNNLSQIGMSYFNADGNSAFWLLQKHDGKRQYTPSFQNSFFFSSTQRAFTADCSIKTQSNSHANKLMKQDLIKNISLDVCDSWDSYDKKEACGSYNGILFGRQLLSVSDATFYSS